jgi:hypothetical protein
MLQEDFRISFLSLRITIPPARPRMIPFMKPSKNASKYGKANSSKNINLYLQNKKPILGTKKKWCMQLLVSVGKGSCALIFYVMMWRDVHVCQAADQALKGMLWPMVVIPWVWLFIVNLLGAVVSWVHLKAIRPRSDDEVLEAILLFWLIVMAPPRYVPREVFIANTLYSVF